MDFRLVCRTCLASDDAEFYRLDAPIVCDEDEEKVSFMECLRFCTRLDDVAQLPVYICTECSRALQVAYNFIRNAVEAHEILRQKLCVAPLQQQRSNGQHVGVIKRDIGADRARNFTSSSSAAIVTAASAGERVMRFRCKICAVKLDTKKSLKEHVKVHLDIISYCCQICDFESKKRNPLIEHYSNSHGVVPTRNQLKPKTLTHSQANNVNYGDMEDTKEDIQLDDTKEYIKLDEVYSQMEQIHNPPASIKQEQEEQEKQLELERIKLELQQQEQLEQWHPQQQQPFHDERQQQLHQQQHQQFHNEQQLHHHQPSLEDEQQLLQQHIDNVLSTETNNMPELAADMNDFGNDFNMANEMSVGNEFIVMADGTVEEVMGNGVVIEYINAVEDGTTLENGLVLNNMVQMEANASNVDELVTMDVDDIIIEESVATEVADEYSQNILPPAPLLPPAPSLPPRQQAANSKKIKCKICSAVFNTQEKLKKHMLTHNEIPHFFCDKCKFYTFFKIDLTQHYKTKHHLQPTYKQLLPKNKVESTEESGYIYSCDMCLFESNLKGNLRRHYLAKHQTVATDVQLRPANADEFDDLSAMPPAPRVVVKQTNNVKYVKPDFPDGMHCKKCNEVFYWRNKLKEHYQHHTLEENAQLRLQPAEVSQYNGVDAEIESSPSASASAGVYTIPSDAIPQVVEMDTSIDNDIDFDFNGDALFEDFDEDEIDDQDDQNEFQDLILTSDDDFEDIIQEQNLDDEQSQSASVLPSHCIHCNKKFFSQYQFENHMFIHRGLAPYRCEMCTNLYNTKRALIRHYKAVHKKMPTRDMIQAKGDKVSVDRMPVEHLNLEKQKSITLMCAKCPFESTEIQNLQIHLATSHGINDENFILQKLPFECPRCIRSYASKVRLIRHLERCHSVATIIQQQQQPPPVNGSLPTSAAGSRCGLVELIESRTEVEDVDALMMSAAASSSSTLAADYYLCNICQFVCDSMQSLNEHNQVHTGNKTRDQFPFQCDICNCKYRSVEALRHHAKRHVARKFSCAECPKSYINRTELEKHMLLHSGDLPYKCDLCEKQFGYPHHLKRHKDIVHFGKRETCPVEGCGKTFTTQGQLKIHAWDHNGNIPYRCSYCGHNFKKREALRQHAFKIHKVTLTEEEIAEIFRKMTGYTNPHDFTIAVSDGKMLRRSDMEASRAIEISEQSDDKKNVLVEYL